MRKFEEPPLGGGGGVTGMAKKKVPNRSLFEFFAQIFEMMSLKLLWFCNVLHNDLSELNPGYVYNRIEKLDADKRAYGWLPLMTPSSGVQIGALCAESFCERILSEANDVCHEGNTLLDMEEISMSRLDVLRMNREFI